MHKTAALLLLGAGWVIAGNACAATGLDDNPNQPAGESLQSWQWMQDVALAEPQGRSPYIAFVVTPGVFNLARLDLEDLRLFDAKNREVPYKVGIRRRDTQLEALAARSFNSVRNPDRSVGISLELDANHIEHNAIDVQTNGLNFRRRVRLEGSDDQNQWGVLFDKHYLVHYQVGANVIDVHRLSYPGSRLRFLRLVVYPEAGNEQDAPEIQSAAVYRSIQEPGEYATSQAELGPREPTRVYGAPGSTWNIYVGAELAAWCEGLSFDVQDAEFVRRWEIELDDGTGTFSVLTQGEWRRRAGAALAPMEIKLPSEVLVKHLRLRLVDDRNKPLDITKVSYSAAVRRVVFARTPDLVPPWRLYFGNPNAPSPNYDFARNLAEPVTPAPDRAELTGTLMDNPIFVAIPKPWTERWPWAIYLALGVACVALLGILAALARRALEHADQTESSAHVA